MTLDDFKDWVDEHKALTIVFICISFVFLLASCASMIDSDTKSTKTRSCSIGDECILYVDGGGWIGAGINEQAFDDLIDARIADDRIGYQQIFLEERAFYVDSGTKVKVIDRGVFKTKVRILEGDQYSKAGWVAYERVIPV